MKFEEGYGKNKLLVDNEQQAEMVWAAAQENKEPPLFTEQGDMILAFYPGDFAEFTGMCGHCKKRVHIRISV